MCTILLCLLISLITWLAPASEAVTVTLAWDQVTRNTVASDPGQGPITDLAGYKIYSGTTNGGPYPTVNDVGLTVTPSAPQASIAGFALSTTYYFVVRAYDTGATNESVNSNQVTVTTPAVFPVAYWFIAETSGNTAVDHTGNGHLATLCQGSTCPFISNGPTWTTGYPGAALHCDGVDDNVQVASAADLNITGDLTITFWMNLRSTTHLSTDVSVDAVAMGNENPVSPFSTPWMVSLTNLAAPHLSWYHHKNGGDYNSTLTFTGHNCLVGTWEYVTFVRTVSNRTVTMYINGASLAALTWTSADDPQASGVQAIFCGSSDRSSTRYANIDLSRVRIYDVALTPTQITALYNEVDVLPPAGPTNLRIVP